MSTRSKLLVDLALAISTNGKQGKERQEDNGLCLHNLQQPSTSTNNTTSDNQDRCMNDDIQMEDSEIHYDRPRLVEYNLREPSATTINTNESDIYLPLSDSESSELFERSSDDYVPENESSDSSNYSLNGHKENMEIVHAAIEIPPEGDGTNGSHISEMAEVSNQPITVNRPKKKNFSPKLKVSRKRQRFTDQWKKQKSALARQKGESYISYKGEEIPSKRIEEGNLCPENCKLGCSKKFSLEQRTKIMSSFYKMDVNGKNAILFNTIQASLPARKRKGATNHKTKSYKYFITSEGNQILVCKRALMALYQISKKKIEVIQNRIKLSSVTCSPDKRGKHNNRPNKIPDDVKNYVKEHISSFPAEFAHYSRTHNISKKYLSPLLTLSKIHKLYLDLCTREHKPEIFRVKECTYRSIFVNKFNLSFRQPRSDTCSRCDSGKSNEEHVENYHAAFESMKIDRETARSSHNVVYVTIDLQQTMPLPRLTTSKAFYLRQLWFYNCGIHIITKDVEKTVFCTWTEQQGSKGSSDIFSSLLTVFEFDSVFRGKDHLIIWSDSCGGQNKNFLIICLHQYLLLKNIFKVIDHKYPEVGHTFLDSDRAFGRIEKILRKHETLFSPDQYRDIIAKSGRHNMVIDMTNHFRKTDDFEKEMKLINRKKDCLKEQVRFRDGVKWFRADTYGHYMYKESYDYYTPFKTVNIYKLLKTTPHLENFTVARVPNKKNHIAQEKIDNLKEQLQYIPEEHQWFYQTIIMANDA